MSCDISAGRDLLPGFPKFVLNGTPCWTTTEQYEFLIDYIPTFLNYTAKNKQLKFWVLLNSAWFTHWPEINKLITQELLLTQASNKDCSDDRLQYIFTLAEQNI